MNPIRDTLFGDMPIEAWGSHGDAEPWKYFTQARQWMASHEPSKAVAALKQVVDSPGLESRHYLQAWHFLRQLGAPPAPAQAKQLLGVVIEVPLENGLDLLAAYADFSSRFYNGPGGGVVLESPTNEIKPLIERLLAVSSTVVSKIGPWEGARPGPPAVKSIRLNFLTPSGLHFGQGPYDDMSRDTMAGPIIAAAIALMQSLVNLANERGKPKV